MRKYISGLLILLCLLFVGCGEDKTVSYLFNYKNTDIAVGIDYNDLSEQIGESKTADSSPSCASTGYDKIFTYSGFEIYTTPDGTKDIITKIVLNDDSVSTKEGIRVGDTKDSVVAIYGTPQTETDSYLSYETDNVKLIFFLKNGETVNTIRYEKG